MNGFSHHALYFCPVSLDWCTAILECLLLFTLLTRKQYPNNTTPINGTAPGELNNAYSPPYYPSPFVNISLCLRISLILA
jgi:hypothetical protein